MSGKFDCLNDAVRGTGADTDVSPGCFDRLMVETAKIPDILFPEILFIKEVIFMTEISILDLQNLRHLISGYSTTHCKMTDYAS